MGDSKKPGDNAMHPLPDWRLMLDRARAAPRCGARTRAGGLCQGPAMPNGRCRMHGGPAGAPSGQANGMWRHGRRSAEVIARRRQALADRRAMCVLIVDLIKQAKNVDDG